MEGFRLVRKCILALILIFIAGPARADCTLLSSGETRPEASIFYNQDFKVFQYCDGTNWRAMLGGGAIDPSLATLTDVDDALAPAHADVLTYDSMSGTWVAGTGGIGVETDPKVGTLTNGKWCTTDGSVVNCATDAPVVTEADPQVGTLTGNKWCASNAGGTAIDCTQDTPGGGGTNCSAGAASGAVMTVGMHCNYGVGGISTSNRTVDCAAATHGQVIQCSRVISGGLGTARINMQCWNSSFYQAGLGWGLSEGPSGCE